VNYKAFHVGGEKETRHELTQDKAERSFILPPLPDPGGLH
jgi:hypothetical protein